MMYHQKNFIILMLLTTAAATQAIIIDAFFNKLDEGRLITGTINVKLSAKSNTHCSVICLSTEKCIAYKYKGTGPKNCFLISKNSTAAEGQIFDNDGINFIYEKICSQDSGETWTPPPKWNGTDPVIYRSFDNMGGLVLLEGTEQRNYAQLVPGKLNCVWSLDRTRSQWVDLGIHTEACMTRPETCGAAGGAISLWLRVIDCPDGAGILSSHQSYTRGSQISCKGSSIRFRVNLPVGSFHVWPSKPTGWIHAVLNYIGPNDGQGIRIYYDGTEVASDTSKYDWSYSAGDSRIVVGRRYTDDDSRYTSVQVDELLFFNQTVSPSEIFALYK